MRKFILGTDWWTDCDDAVALRLLCRAVKCKEIDLLGIGINACMEYSVASVDGFLCKEGIEGVAIGLDRKATDFGGNPPYQKRLAAYSKTQKTNEDAQDATRLYRRILAQADEKIEIIEIGYLQVLSSVLESGPDDISEKSGFDLIKEKVEKVWIMAGKWDEEPGAENNFIRNDRSRKAGNIVCEKLPVPITFLGFEAGKTVISGGELKKDDFLYDVLCDHNSANGRSSWDPMLVQLAIIGDEQKAGYKTVSGIATVDAKSGENYFKEQSDGPHKYVVKIFDDEYYKNQINSLI